MLRLACRAHMRQRLLVTPMRSMWALNTDAYHRFVDVTIEGVQEVYEDEADDDLELNMEVECADGVLNVTVGEHGTFVINKQTPNLQLWLSSPVSGPLRYDFVPEAAAWHNTRDEHELLGLLASDFETLVGKRLDFGRVAEALREEAEKT